MKKNLRFLYIAYQYPPHGGAAVQRAERQVRSLVNNGFDVTVLTTSAIDIEDASINASNNVAVKIIRTFDIIESIVSKLKSKYFGKLISFVLYPDKQVFWTILSYIKTRKLSFDIVLSSSYPYSSHLIGFALKIKNPKIKWVIDYRDAWTNNPSMLYKKKYIMFSFINKYLEAYLNKNSDCLITVSNNLKKYIINSDKEINVVYNAFKESDFECLNYNINSNESFTIFYMGSLYFERNPRLFIDVLLNIKSKHPFILKNISFKIVGINDYDYLKNLFIQFTKMGMNLEIMEYMPHKDVLKLASASNLLLLLIDDTYGADAVVTGKLLEYINLNVPVLGIVPLVSEARDIINNSCCGFTICPNEYMKTSQIIVDQFNLWNKNINVNLNQDFDYISNFSENYQNNIFIETIYSLYNGEK